MRVTDSIIAWLIPSILLWGGCATPALLRPFPPAHEETPSNSQATDSDEDEKPPRMVCAEAALVRETALAKGYSPALADRFEQAILNAPTQDRPFLMSLSFAQLNGPSNQKPTTESPRAPATSDERPPSPDTGHLVPKMIGDGDETPAVAPSGGHLSDESVTDTVDSAPSQAESPKNASHTSSSDLQPSATAEEVSSTGLSLIDTQGTGPAKHAPESVPSDTDLSEPAASPSASNVERATLASGTSGVTQTAPPDEDESDPDPSNLSWQKQLRQAIVRLQQDLDNHSLDEIDTQRLRACLSLLQLAADDPEKAMATLEGLDEQQLEFWRQTVMGLGILLDPEELPKMRHRVELATPHLQKGVSTLSSFGPLRLVNLTFCTSVIGYGTFDECDAYALTPGREVLLYVEVENFAVDEIESDGKSSTYGRSTRSGSRSTPRYPLYTTDLHGRYEILDQDQRVVLSRSFDPNRDRSRNYRHDYFIPYSLRLPQNIAPGAYTLELTMEDKIGKKFGSATIDFRIR